MNSSLRQRSYEGKDLFIGIDVHKRTYSVAVVMEGALVKKWQTLADPVKLAHQLTAYFPKALLHSVYEAGFSGFILHRQLTNAGIDNRIVNAASIETAVHNRVKTDKREALKLSALLEAGRLPGIRIPSEAEESHRLVSRTRQQLVEERSAVKNRIRMKAHQLGLIAAEDRRRMSQTFIKDLLEQSPSKEFTLIIDAYWQVWQMLETQIKRLDEQLAQQANRDPNEQTYRSAPGIGPLGARVLSNELGDMSQFNNERQLFSFTGLTPSEHSSGDSVRRGHITRQDNSRLRWILCEAAWRAIRQDQDLRNFFEHLYPRTGKKRAIVAVARKLIGRIRAAFRREVRYQMTMIP